MSENYDAMYGYDEDDELDYDPDVKYSRDYYIRHLAKLGADPDDYVDYTIRELKQELEEMYDEYNDTSSMHPNETLEEFMEHEDFD